MDNAINPATRPSRLPFLAHLAVVGLLLLSFLSGALLWYGEWVNADAGFDASRFNLRPWRILHGVLNPILCIVFGSLLVQHIRLGWQMKANRLSGVFMETVFVVLILTGLGIYYAPATSQNWLVLTHKISGLLVPFSLTLHWICARIWVKKNCSN